MQRLDKSKPSTPMATFAPGSRRIAMLTTVEKIRTVDEMGGPSAPRIANNGHTLPTCQCPRRAVGPRNARIPSACSPIPWQGLESPGKTVKGPRIPTTCVTDLVIVLVMRQEVPTTFIDPQIRILELETRVTASMARLLGHVAPTTNWLIAHQRPLIIPPLVGTPQRDVFSLAAPFETCVGPHRCIECAIWMECRPRVTICATPTAWIPWKPTMSCYQDTAIKSSFHASHQLRNCPRSIRRATMTNHNVRCVRQQ